MPRIFDSRFDAAHYDDPVFSAHAIMADNQEEANANLATTVKKLGAGYRGRRAWPRRTETRDPAAAAAGEEQDKAESLAAPALRTGFQYRRPPPEPDTDDDNAENPPILSDQVLQLGYGYRGRRTWARRSTSYPNRGQAAALQAVYRYRRPVPCQDDDDDDNLPEAQDATKPFAQHKLEAGLTGEAHGPPEEGEGNGDGVGDDKAADDDGRHGGDGDDNRPLEAQEGDKASPQNPLEAGLREAGHGSPAEGDGGDAAGEDNGRSDGEGGDAGDDDNDLYTASSPHNPISSLDSEAALAFAREWDGAGNGGQADLQLLCSPDPALFQEEREAARSMLAAGAFYASAAKAMVEKHEEARKEADQYLDEVNLATKMLATKEIAV